MTTRTAMENIDVGDFKIVAVKVGESVELSRWVGLGADSGASEAKPGRLRSLVRRLRRSPSEGQG